MTPEQLLKVMPYSAPRLATFAAPLAASMQEFGITTPLRQAHFIAQIALESTELLHLKELGSDERFRVLYEGRRDLGNTQPGDGARFPGRGLIDITGRANYELYGRLLRMTLILRPELLETPEGACRSAGAFWHTHGLNEQADADNLGAIRHHVNGGYNGLDQCYHYLRRGLKELNL